jgi:hypothetical protein
MHPIFIIQLINYMAHSFSSCLSAKSITKWHDMIILPILDWPGHPEQMILASGVSFTFYHKLKFSTLIELIKNINMYNTE